MRLTLVNGPAAEPLTLDEAKAHLRLDGDDEDALLASLIATSRAHVEAALGLALLTQTWRWQADVVPARGLVELMMRPVERIERVAVEGDEVAAADYALDAGRGRLALHHAAGTRRRGAVEVVFVAGYGDAAGDVPEPIRQALRLLVAHWYEVRNPVHIGSIAARVPDTVSELLQPYRARRL